MAQHAPDMMQVLKQVRKKRCRKPEVGLRTPAPKPTGVMPASNLIIDLSPPPITKKKKTKRKERSGKSSKSPRKSSKRVQPSSEGADNRSTFMLMGIILRW